MYTASLDVIASRCPAVDAASLEDQIRDQVGLVIDTPSCVKHECRVPQPLNSYAWSMSCDVHRAAMSMLVAVQALVAAAAQLGMQAFRQV
jgi:hypothetical protein